MRSPKIIKKGGCEIFYKNVWIGKMVWNSVKSIIMISFFPNYSSCSIMLLPHCDGNVRVVVLASFKVII